MDGPAVTPFAVSAGLRACLQALRTRVLVHLHGVLARPLAYSHKALADTGPCLQALAVLFTSRYTYRVTSQLPCCRSITSGARGADQLGFRWALKHHVRSRCFAADWERFGKAAGVRRNHHMAQAGDVLVAFHVHNSPGTAHMIACMRALGKPVVIIDATA